MEEDVRNVEKAVNEMKELYNKFLERNGQSSLRISNKEFNLWIAKKLMEQDGEIIKLKTRQGLLYLITTGLLLKLIFIP